MYYCYTCFLSLVYMDTSSCHTLLRCWNGPLWNDGYHLDSDGNDSERPEDEEKKRSVCSYSCCMHHNPLHRYVILHWKRCTIHNLRSVRTYHVTIILGRKIIWRRYRCRLLHTNYTVLFCIIVAVLSTLNFYQVNYEAVFNAACSTVN